MALRGLRKLPPRVMPCDQVAYEEDLPEPDEAKPLLPALPQPPPDFEQVPTPASPPDRHQETFGVEEPFTIDLATALQLGGADALQIQIAREKAYQAQVELSKSRLILLPTLWYGVGWNHHDGRIQATPGNVITTSFAVRSTRAEALASKGPRSAERAEVPDSLS